MRTLIFSLMICLPSAQASANGICINGGDVQGPCIQQPDFTPFLPRPRVDIPTIQVPPPPPPPPLPAIDPPRPPLGSIMPPTPVFIPTPTLDLPSESEIFNRVMPQANIEQRWGNARSWPELSALQSEIIQNLPKLSEEFYNSAAEKAATDPSLTFETVSRFVPPSSDASPLRVAVPQIKTNGELKSSVEAVMKRSLDFSRKSDNDLFSMTLFRLAKIERPFYENYIQSQNAITVKALASCLGTMTQSLERTQLQTMTQQRVALHGEMAQNTASNDLREELDKLSLTKFSRPPAATSLKETYHRLSGITSSAPQARISKQFGFAALYEADQAYARQESDLGDSLAAAAKIFADIGLGFIPVVGEVRDLYEFLTGQSLLTGEELTTTERGLALAGVVTAGIITTISKGSKVAITLGSKADEIEKITKSAGEITTALEQMGAKNSESLATLTKAAHSTGLRDPLTVLKDVNEGIVLRVKALGYKMSDVKIGLADTLNDEMRAIRPTYKASFKPGSKFITATLEEDGHFIRVFNSEKKNLVGGWVTDPRLLEGKTPEAIAKTLNIVGYIPDKAADVIIPRGTRVRISVASQVRVDSAPGALQVEFDALNDAIRYVNIRGLKK